jgi:methionine-rich copper-binding protein CopC
MRSLRMVGLIAYIVAAWIIGALSFERSLAATASTGVVTSHPKANEIVDGSMVDIVLGFEVPVDHERSTLNLRSGRGDRQLRPRLESAPNYLFGTAGRLVPGAYQLEWTALLSGGQFRSGTIPFTVASSRGQVSASSEWRDGIPVILRADLIHRASLAATNEGDRRSRSVPGSRNRRRIDLKQ